MIGPSFRGIMVLFTNWSDPELNPLDDRPAIATWNDEMSLLACPPTVLSFPRIPHGFTVIGVQKDPLVLGRFV